MKDLIIVTTRRKFLPGTEMDNEDHLFAKSKCEVVPTTALSTAGFAQTRLFRLNSKTELVFGADCLESKEDLDKREDFFPALLKDALDAIPEGESVDQVSRLILVAHRDDIESNQKDDLGPNKKFFLEKEPRFLENLRMANLFGERTVQTGKDLHSQSTQGIVAAFVVGFSHAPGQHGFYDVLTRYRSFFPHSTRPKALLPGQLITKIVSYETGVAPEEKWMENWEVPADTEQMLKLEFARFRFTFYRIDSLNQIDVAGKDHFPLQKAMAVLQNNRGADLINVVFVSILDLAAHKKMEQWVEGLFGPNGILPVHIGEQAMPPTLFIGYKHIMGNPESVVSDGLRLDPRYRFLDSSIWCRYAALEDDFTEHLRTTLNTFAWAYRHRLYTKNVCREFLEFNFRLLVHSRLHDFGDGHSWNVFPFVFHSESQMHERAKPTFERFIKQRLQWNILLLDDYADLPLRQKKYLGQANEKAIENVPQQTKGNLIEGLLLGFPAMEDQVKDLANGIENRPSIVKRLERCIGVPEAVKQYFDEHTISKQRFLPDIILLDYLFSEPREKQHFGTKLLDDIKRGNAKQGKSVLQSYWIHPITVFNEAMLSDLQEKNHQHFEENWFLARGADPINTPHLFRCSLFEFMGVQANKLLFTQDDLWNFLADHPLYSDKLQGDSDKPLSPIDRDKAQSAFRTLIERFSADGGMPKQSAIGQSAEQQLREGNVQRLREHLRKILYLFAYTSGFDFPVIEREFKQIQRLYNHFKADCAEGISSKKLEELENAMQTLAAGVYSIAHKYF